MDAVRRAHIGLDAWWPRLGVVVALLSSLALPAPGEAAGSAGDACPAHLFVIARSKNANIVVYDANLGPGGDFVASAPVVVYWLLNGEKGKREELNAVQRDHAYGVDVVRADAPGTYAMTFKAERKRGFTVRMLNGCPVVTGSLGGENGILRKIFVQSKEDSLRPKVQYIEFFAEDAASGKPLYEKYIPGK
jgi:hypothetical protein